MKRNSRVEHSRQAAEEEKREREEKGQQDTGSDG